MLIDEEDVVLEACVEVSFEAKFTNDRVVVAIDVSVDAIHALEYLSNHAREGFWEWDTCKY